jgi:alkanesulfonate monooxygenase SsuD/methylene tetrahydromethanopterin reductase-like flavin-dependent oxidoreductase (luciferase family)
MHLTKEVAKLQELSGGRFTLGVGMGWHKDEFDFIGVEFQGRGRRADEAGDLGRRQLGARSPAGARPGRRVASLAWLRRSITFAASRRSTRKYA